MLDEPTRDRLLAAAENLLLSSDYDEVSVRAINTAAGMNPAAVHYHFGSKEALVAALLERRLAPLWAAELTRVTERRQTGWVPGVAELVDVIMGPFVGLVAEPHGRLHVRLLARLVLGRRPVSWASGWFGFAPWVELLRAARPDLSADEAKARWMLAFDLIVQTFSAGGEAKALRSFVIAGLDAP
ncbi:helix-turn-helix domain-containing protein [Amycolatopsis alkalitolerans]|uniref:Helix-turn-helix transcriptional regulator n=1 Tax=Amycolatopsis alkalitolerans TaxID=2547244 RepID=A0A5C4M755_9PSEU|nr:helix-turn-helix domain-containing protein [Amycolatopsis alkalitolerans]TNC27798.1 helix-turn-helix transcriptional regulator [Amycolatopsis alkalitolerans]